MKPLPTTIIALCALLSFSLAAPHKRREFAPGKTTWLHPASSTHFPDNTIRELTRKDGSHIGYFVVTTTKGVRGWHACDVRGKLTIPPSSPSRRSPK